MSSKEYLVKLDAFYPELKSTFIELYQEKDVKIALNRFEKVIDYNVPHGKKLRGLCVYESFLILSKELKFKNDYEKKALALGWCIELLQASFLVADDIMDNSQTRRGQLCWYLNKGVGNMAINDAFYILSCVNMVIKKFLSSHPLYAKFYELFSEIFMQTTIGQNLDLIIGAHDSTSQTFDFTQYTQENYNAIVKWKTAYYSFYLPVASALYLAHIDDNGLHHRVKEILLEMGHFFQVQDDFLDCYGDANVTGKIGTDIQEAKCSWLITCALTKCTHEQRELLEKNYGKNDRNCVLKVKEIYNELNLKNDYEIFELEQHKRLKSKIESLNFADYSFTSEIKELLNTYLSKIFQRIY